MYHPRARRYDFDTVHAAAKQSGAAIDNCMIGYESLGLLLWYGDLRGARAGFAKVLDAHKRVLDYVRQGTASADGCVRRGSMPSCLLSF